MEKFTMVTETPKKRKSTGSNTSRLPQISTEQYLLGETQSERLGLILSTFLTERSFQDSVEELARDHRIGHMDAVIQFCSDNDIDIEDIGPFVSCNLKEKIRQDAIDYGYMKSTAQIPF